MVVSRAWAQIYSTFYRIKAASASARLLYTDTDSLTLVVEPKEGSTIEQTLKLSGIQRGSALGEWGDDDPDHTLIGWVNLHRKGYIKV